jgi:hypothetical protein
MRSSNTRYVIRAGWRPASWRPLLPAAGLVLLGACAAFDPPATTTSRAYPGVDQQTLYQRTVAAFQASDLKVTGNDPANGVVTGVGSVDGDDWAECSKPRLLVKDGKERHYLIDAEEKDREVELTASITGGPQEATLTLDPAFTATPAHPMATTPDCQTTGALEHEIFEAVAKP